MRKVKLLKVVSWCAAAFILAITAAPIVGRPENSSTEAQSPIGGLKRSITEMRADIQATKETSPYIKNVPYRDCDWDEAVKSSDFNESTPDAYAHRMIYSYAQMSRVLRLQDCTCHGKVAPYAEVQNIESWLTNTQGPDWKRITVGQQYFDASVSLRRQAVQLCGDDF